MKTLFEFALPQTELGLTAGCGFMLVGNLE